MTKQRTRRRENSLAATYWVKTLRLTSHPEGGFFRETYRSFDSFGSASLPKRFGGRRAASTAIYFLLKAGFPSRLHRIKSDEIWHFYAGGTLRLDILSPKTGARRLRLGPRGPFQAVVPAGAWFGARVESGSYALVGCTVAPGFDFEDFEVGTRAALLSSFPRHRKTVLALTDRPARTRNRRTKHP